MFAGDKIANGWAPFNSATAFRASELETKQTPGSEMFKSATDPRTGTDHPSFKSLSFTDETTAGTRLTEVQPGSLFDELVFAAEECFSLIGGFWRTGVSVMTGTDGNKAVNAPDRNNC